jgi:hypothetical protein
LHYEGGPPEAEEYQTLLAIHAIAVD